MSSGKQLEGLPSPGFERKKNLRSTLHSRIKDGTEGTRSFNTQSGPTRVKQSRAPNQSNLRKEFTVDIINQVRPEAGCSARQTQEWDRRSKAESHTRVQQVEQVTAERREVSPRQNLQQTTLAVSQQTKTPATHQGVSRTDSRHSDVSRGLKRQLSKTPVVESRTQEQQVLSASTELSPLRQLQQETSLPKAEAAHWKELALKLQEDAAYWRALAGKKDAQLAKEDAAYWRRMRAKKNDSQLQKKKRQAPSSAEKTHTLDLETSHPPQQPTTSVERASASWSKANQEIGHDTVRHGRAQATRATDLSGQGGDHVEAPRKAQDPAPNPTESITSEMEGQGAQARWSTQQDIVPGRKKRSLLSDLLK